MKEHTVKDNILCYLRTIGNGDFYKECLASECAEKLNIEYDIAFSAIDNLIIDKLIDFRDAASKGTLRYEKLIRINHHGLFFLRQGGFTSAKRTDNQRRRLNVAKEAMTYISTFAIIIISYLNYIATDKANENKEIIANYDLTIKKLTSKVDSLQTLVKRDTTKKHKNSH